ncbi:pollen-specific leucine-rich repeat extensin-like protein 2 [Penaeus japonicus]|uniref:pollen-specific leucine-rich repeat extensin-like protein 2 n=1 Tax=Penaeus japonicus TaxID=27405 RepID=UPI001C716E2B|nr:pollen-specific leucine-rich repeat extensin-like protein 2 [Penaeus japonicus]
MSQEENKQTPSLPVLNTSEESIIDLCNEMNDLNKKMREVGRKLNQLRVNCVLLTIEQAILCDPVTRDALSLAGQGQTYLSQPPEQPELLGAPPLEPHPLPPSTEPVAEAPEEGRGSGEGPADPSPRSAGQEDPVDKDGNEQDVGLPGRRTPLPPEMLVAGGSLSQHLDVDLSKPPPSLDPRHLNPLEGMLSVPPAPNQGPRDMVLHPFQPPPPPPPPGWNVAMPPEVDLTRPPPRWVPRETTVAGPSENPKGQGADTGDAGGAPGSSSTGQSRF